VKESEHIIAFIDILGYTNEIEQYIENNNQAFLKKIYITIKNFERKIKDLIIKFKLINNVFKIHYKIFSDTIIVYTNLDILLEFKYFEIALFFHMISEINFIFLEAKILIRGGVAKGRGFITKNIMFSSALTKAIEIEKNQSIYPRIVVENEIIDEIKNMYNVILKEKRNGSGKYIMVDVDYCETLFDDLFVLDWDYSYFINPFYQFIFNIQFYMRYLDTKYGDSIESKNCIDKNNSVINELEILIASNMEQKHHIKLKYIWLLNFIDWLRFKNSKIKFDLLRFHTDEEAHKIEDKSNSVANDPNYS